MIFACVNYGTKYSVEYVQKLYNMVKRNTTIPHQFVCFTDHVKLQKLVTGDIQVRQFKYHNMDGWWNKMQLFNECEEETLYMDLDVVITGNIDCFFTHEPEAEFVGMNDFNPATEQFNSSIMRWKRTKGEHIWNEFNKDKAFYYRMFGDQVATSHIVRKETTTKSFPDAWTQSYKWFDRKGERYAKAKQTYSHNGESIVTVFHGHPNPHESTQEWVKNAWK
jgi:hypothetical protein